MKELNRQLSIIAKLTVIFGMIAIIVFCWKLIYIGKEIEIELKEVALAENYSFGGFSKAYDSNFEDWLTYTLKSIFSIHASTGVDEISENCDVYLTTRGCVNYTDILSNFDISSEYTKKKPTFLTITNIQIKDANKGVGFHPYKDIWSGQTDITFRLSHDQEISEHTKTLSFEAQSIDIDKSSISKEIWQFLPSRRLVIARLEILNPTETAE